MFLWGSAEGGWLCSRWAITLDRWLCLVFPLHFTLAALKVAGPSDVVVLMLSGLCLGVYKVVVGNNIAYECY